MKKMLFSLICAIAMSMTAFAETETTVYYAIPDATVGSYTVKLNVCLEWNKPDPSKEPVTVWKQFDMQKTDKTFNANPIYKATFTDKWDGANTMQFQLYDGEAWKSQEVAFDGSSTGDWTTADTYNGKMWVYGETGWQTYLPDVSIDPTFVTLYYVNTTKWENVNAYVWADDAYKSWPGEAMTKTGDQVNGFDVYSYTFPTDYVNVIFNLNDAVKTADLTWNAATPYYYGDKWYADLKDIPAPASTVTLYYVNTNKWENVNAYAWYTEGETNHEKAAWAGEAMTKTGEQVNGFDVYSYTLETEYVNVIFNDGGTNKTADLTWNAATPYYYGDKWYAALKDIPAPATTVTLYYVNTNKWENVNAYAWYTEGETNHEKAAWSGEAMTKTGDQVNGFDVYSYTLETEYVNVIFNDGGTNKTADLTWDAATPYYYGDKWYAALKDIPAPATTITLYYVNTNKWENVNAYAWYTEGETNHEKAAWSGEAMTKTGDQVNGFDVYSYTFETEYVNIIFNDGGANKTADLTWNAATPYYYGDKWYADLKDIPAPATTVTLYYVNTNKWENVNAYAWYTEGETNHEKAAWAGEAMTKTGEQVNGFDVYSYTLETEYVNIIFNDGGTNKTADLTWNAATPYYYGDKWYADLKDIPAEGGETPTPDFGIMVNDNDYYAGVKNDEYVGEGSEYAVTVTLAVDDKFTNYDNVAKAAWLVALDDAGYKFNAVDNHYVVTEAGEYTFYIKIIGEGKDNMFVSLKKEITRVDYVLNNAGELANDDAKMFVHTWGDGMADEDILMTAVMDGETVVGYKAAINNLTQYLVFVRMKPEAEAIDWENNWGKSGDLLRCESNNAYFTGWNEAVITVSCDAPTSVDTIEQEVVNGKIIENGVLYIIRDGKRYNAQGVEVK